MKLDQLFYGRGDDGYAVLDASFDGAEDRSTAERLCRAIGSPLGAGTKEDEPFLMQREVGGRLFMACGRSGPLDPMGRPTLVFHFLIADSRELVALGLSAADFWRAGFFRAAPPEHPLPALDVDPAPLREACEYGEPQIAFPAVVSTSRENNLKILGLLGSRAVGTNWATFSWEPVKDCIAVGLAPWRNHLTLDGIVNTYDVLGCPFPRIADASSSNPGSKPLPPGRAGAARPSREGRPGPVIALAAVLLLASLAANALLFRELRGRGMPPPARPRSAFLEGVAARLGVPVAEHAVDSDLATDISILLNNAPRAPRSPLSPRERGHLCAVVPKAQAEALGRALKFIDDVGGRRYLLLPGDAK